MKKITFILAVLLSVQLVVFAQHATDVIKESEARRILQYLAADSMKGRGNGSAELLQAGIFIGNEFHKSGLHPWPGYFSYYMPFRPFGGQKNVVTEQKLQENGQPRVVSTMPTGRYFLPASIDRLTFTPSNGKV